MEKINEKLLNSIGSKRLGHSIRVMKEAEKLAKCYGEDIEKASLAGLLHDCGRYEDKSYLLKKAQEFGIILDEIYKKNDNLLHAHLGVEVARHDYGISDTDILNAIRYHTTGRENMSLLEKIVYMADYIEPGREFKGLDEIRSLCYESKDIDKALIGAIDNTIIYILNNKAIIHEDTIKARNFLLLNM